MTMLLARSAAALLVILVVSCDGFLNPYRGRDARAARQDVVERPGDIDVGEPLFLTPLIQEGLLAEARIASLVGPLEGTSIVSYTGFLTVNPTYNSNIFFWFIPAQTDPSTAPVAVWLQGGPGSSSLFGLFAENGPWTINANMTVYDKEYTWATPFSMIYIDNPVGTGFSFTDDDAGFANNETDVARDLYEALQQFFTLFYEFQDNDFYITGESYGGKYIPAIAYKIDTENPSADLKINLKGIAIGDGLIDPETQYDYGKYLYNVGLIDDSELDLYTEQQNEMVANIQKADYMAALYNFDILVAGGFVLNTSYYKNFTGLMDTYNYLRHDEPLDQNYYEVYVTLPAVRASIHVGNLTYNSGDEVETHLNGDVMQSTKSWVESLLNSGYKVLLYNGQVDVIIPYMLTKNMIDHFNWTYAADYQTASRIIWKVAPEDKEIAGYVKTSHNFIEIMVRDAGHILPYDQPRVAYDMITRFVFDRSFDD